MDEDVDGDPADRGEGGEEPHRVLGREAKNVFAFAYHNKGLKRRSFVQIWPVGQYWGLVMPSFPPTSPHKRFYLPILGHHFPTSLFHPLNGT